MTVNRNNFDVKHNNQNGHKSGETGSDTGKGADKRTSHLDSDESLDQYGSRVKNKLLGTL